MPSESNQALGVVRDVGRAVLSERNVSALLSRVLDVLSRRLGMLRCTFTLRSGDELRIEASAGLDEAEKARGHYRLGEGVTGRVAQTGEPEVVQDVAKDRRWLNRTRAHRAGERVSFVCVPILHDEGVVGTLSVERPVEAGADLGADLLLLETVGTIVAGAVQARRQEIAERESLVEENRRLREALNPPDAPLPSFIGTSSEMRAAYRLIRQVAPSDATVLLRGPSGTGKELAAAAIRALSPRRDRPFVTLNCAALPEALVESELFGHEKGAFTGAVARRIGRVEAAAGGTLFLDEIGDLTPQTQIKLLRFLQERTYSRVGSNEELHSDVRIIAATSRDLDKRMAEGAFREDLYYRLNVFPIALPPLCRRRGDVIPLANHFIEKGNLRYGKRVRRLSATAVNLLVAYQWPGNVRELENCIERALLTTTDDCIHGYNLPPSLQQAAAGASGAALPASGQADYYVLVDSFERELIVEALKRNRGNMSAAGREVGLSPRVMHYKVHHLGITPSLYRP